MDPSAHYVSYSEALEIARTIPTIQMSHPVRH